jgi:hypothetical protein
VSRSLLTLTSFRTCSRIWAFSLGRSAPLRGLMLDVDCMDDVRLGGVLLLGLR